MIGIKLTIYTGPSPLLFLSLPSLRHVTADMYSLLGLRRVEAKWKEKKKKRPTQNKVTALLPLGAAKWTAWPCVYLLRGPQPGIQRRDVFFKEWVDCWREGGGGFPFVEQYPE